VGSSPQPERRFRTHPLRAIHSSSGHRGKSYAIRFGRRFTALPITIEILRDPNIDVVVIVSRNPQHASQAIAGLAQRQACVRGEANGANGRGMPRTFIAPRRKPESKSQSGSTARYAPSYVELKKLLRRRAGPGVISCRINSPGISGSLLDGRSAIGGLFWARLVISWTLMYWLLESEPVAVSAFSLPTGKQDPIGRKQYGGQLPFRGRLSWKPDLLHRG